MSKLRKSSLTIRKATLADVPAIVELSKRVYGEMAMIPEMVKGQLSHFPEGQFVAEYDGVIVGHCATFVITGDLALKVHSWKEITGNGFASRHNPYGDYLYGMEVCVDESYRGLRIGQRLYDARKKLCQEMALKGIIFGGRMPNYSRPKAKGLSAEEYVKQVAENKLRDPVVGFHLRNGFEVIGILQNYLPFDKQSKGYATHMVWHNPFYDDQSAKSASQRGRMTGSVRIAIVQFQVRKVESREHFESQLEYFVDIASDYRADFICFPEMVTLALLSTEKQKLTPEASIERITKYTDRYVEFMRDLAISYNVNIIGGSHPTKMPDGSLENICYVFLRDGSVHTQAKLHPTPNERYWWNMSGGSSLGVIHTDCGPIGVQICYDAEFPEPTRQLADQGALILFVPFCTDERQGYKRVRYCAQSRAIENQMYVAMAGIVGNLPDVENMDIHYAESAILTPCDFPFARDGIAAEAPPNTETIIFADLRLDNLLLSRNSGTVMNLKDRRFDLYRVEWMSKPKI